MSVYTYTSCQCISTHNVSIYLHILSLYIYTFCQCISTHLVSVYLHIGSIYMYTLSVYTYTCTGDCIFVQSKATGLYQSEYPTPSIEFWNGILHTSFIYPIRCISNSQLKFFNQNYLLALKLTLKFYF